MMLQMGLEFEYFPGHHLHPEEPWRNIKVSDLCFILNKAVFTANFKPKLAKNQILLNIFITIAPFIYKCSVVQIGKIQHTYVPGPQRLK